MAVPPTIPTSFVPKQPVAPRMRRMESGTSAFVRLGVALLMLSLIVSGAAFGYSYYLKGVRAEKIEALKVEQSKVSDTTVEGFIRLRNRLSVAQDILNNHVMTSQLFDELENRTLADVRFSGFEYDTDPDGTITITMDGTARTFNALAAQSAAFAEEGSRIRRAIFSDISTDDKAGVSFSLTAIVDPALVAIPATVPAGWDVEAAGEPVATSTPPVSTSTTPSL